MLQLCRFACEKGVAIHFEQPRLALATDAAKGINGQADPDISETAGAQELG